MEYRLEIVVLPVSDVDKARDGSFVSFEDPDSNGWLVQEITTRLPGR